jgi:hypothetical protein
MSTQNIAYSANTAITMDLSALGSSATFVAGRSSAEVDNTTNKYDKVIVRGLIIVGTTPTLPCQLNVYIVGADTSMATTNIDTLAGTDAAKTLTNTTVLTNALVLARAMPILVNTSNTTYYMSPVEISQFFGGIVPKFWGLFVAHNHTAALKTDAGNTNSFSYNGITYTNA